MIKIKRSDLCPCWSWKKAKKCYYNTDPYNNNCGLFLLEKRNEYIPFIQEYLDGAINEIVRSVGELKDIKAIRSQISLLIILVDLLSKVWVRFNYRNNATTDNNLRLKNRFEKFISTENNKYRKENEDLHKFTSDDFANLRNSLLHKFALPKDDPITWRSIILNNDSSHKLAEQFREKHVLLSPLELMNLIREWYVLMIDEISKNPNNIEYLKWINYIWLQLHKEWAVLMEWKEVKNNIFM